MCAGQSNNSVVSEGSIILGVPDDRWLYGDEDILLGTAEESIIPGIPDDRWLYGDEDVLLGTADPGDDVLDEDDEIIGEAVDWPFGPPDLRTEIRIKQLRGEFPETTIISLKEQQQRREAEEAAALSETEELLRTVGLKAKAVKRLLRAHPRIAKLPVEQLREHLAYIREVFPRGDAAASVVTGAQSLLGHAQLQETLPLKLATIERETGLDATQVALLAPGGVIIPASYTSYLAPVTAAKLHAAARGRAAADGAHGGRAQMETPYVVKLHAAAALAPPLQCFTFIHPRGAGDGDDNSRYAQLRFDRGSDAPAALCHGFAGYFHAVLYGDVTLSIYPPTATDKMFSWFPLYVPLREPLLLPAGQRSITAQLWRCVGPSRVWYEWALTEPQPCALHNPNGRSYFVGLA
jgi:hypothetical protein